MVLYVDVYKRQGEELPAEMGEVAQVNANDGTCEGIKYKKWNCFTVQFLSLIHIFAYYESLGLEGMKAYADTLKAVREAGVPVIADIKRGDRCV